MSGPKSGTMTIEQQRALQLRAERDKNASLVKNALQKIEGFKAVANSECRNMGALGAEVWRNCQPLLEECKRDLLRLAAKQYPAALKEAGVFNDALQVELQQRLDQASADLESLMRVEKRYAADKASLSDLVEFAHSLDTHLRQQPFDFMHAIDEVEAVCAQDQGSETFGQESLSALQESASSEGLVSEDVAHCYVDVCELVSLEALDLKTTNALLGFVEDLSRLVDSYREGVESLISVKNTLGVGDALLRRAWHQAETKREAYEECQLYWQRCQSYSGTEEPLAPMRSFSSLNELEQCAASLRKRADLLAEDTYIADALDAVMRRHGNTIKRSIRLAASATGHCVYANEGSDVGIHVYRSSEGAVMMETASVNRSVVEGEDGLAVIREPARSAYDRRRLVEAQQTFCCQFAEYETELADYGIRLDKRSDMPPSESNAILLSATSDVRTDGDIEYIEKREKREEKLVEREMR